MIKNIIIGIMWVISILCFCNCAKKDMLPEDKYRPLIHYSPKSGFLGELSGFLFYDNEYHLFYQYNPEETSWGRMHWGHAISSDLLQWKEMPIALSPDSIGYMLPGSIVVDSLNTTGLGKVEHPPFVAFFTYYDDRLLTKSVSVAYSLDKGLSWIKCKSLLYINNKYHNLSFPKVFWYKPLMQWRMLALSDNSILLFSSTDCIHWSYVNNIEIQSESNKSILGPIDVYPIESNNSDDIKWVLTFNVFEGVDSKFSSIKYIVGEFDGFNFNYNKEDNLYLDYGMDCSFGLSCNNTTRNKNIFVGWMNNKTYASEVPSVGWRGATTMPRELNLIKEYSNEFRIVSNPIKELDSLNHRQKNIDNVKTFDSKVIFKDIAFDKFPFRLKLIFDNSENTAVWTSQNFGIKLESKSGESVSLGYNNLYKYYYIDRRTSLNDKLSKQFNVLNKTFFFEDSKFLEWDVIIDKCSIELFCAGNRIALTDLIFSNESYSQIELYSQIGEVKLKQGSIIQLSNNH